MAWSQSGNRCLKPDCNYSGLVSEVPEKAATMAGAITIPTKVRPIRRSCMEVFLRVGFGLAGSELVHTMMMPEVM